MAQPSGPKSSTQASRTTTTNASSMSLEGVKKIGKYEIQKKIGAGGMGAVFLAVDAGLKRSVALKVLPQDKASNPTLVKRFKSEAQAAANLRHDNIVMVYEAGEADGYLYIALEYVEGTDVANLVQKRGVMPVKRTIDVIRQTALALQHAHEQGIVHRDIKPGNLLIRLDGTVKLADMGLARAVDDHMDTSITRAGTTVGTVDYMSPEQARDSKAADVRSDLYSLGCTWYYMLTGVPPFPDGSMTNKLRAHAETTIPDPRDLNPGVTEAVFAVIRRMTEKNPARRYQTPTELIEDLDGASISGDIVSEAILGGIEDDTATIPKRKGNRKAVSDDDDLIIGGSDDRPRKRPNLPALDPSGPGLKPGKEPKEAKASEFVRALPFYVVVVLLVCGVLGGLAWIVKNYSSTIDGPQRDANGNPFASNSGQPGEMGVTVGPDGKPIAGTAPGDAGHAPAGTAQPQSQGQATSQAINGTVPPANTNQSQVIQGTTTPGTSIDGQSGTGQTIQGTPIPGSGLPGDPKTVRIGSPGAETAASGTGSPGGTSISGSGTPGSKGASGSSRNGTPRNSPSAKERRQKEDALLPPWSTHPAGSAIVEGPRQPRLFVRRNSKEGDRHPDLNAALTQAPSGGATIVLEGPGPFVLSPVRVADKTRIVIRTDEQTRTSEPPLVILVPSETAPLGLEFVNTSVELHDIHLGLAGSALNPPREGAFLSLQGGDLTVSNSSLSVVGRSASPLTAVRIVAPPAGNVRPPSRVLIDDSTIRGNTLTALAIDAPQTEIVVRHSLLWSGAAPALQFGGMAGGSGQRRIQLVSSTVSSTVAALEIAGDAAHPAPTAIEWINSLAAVPTSQGAPLVRFEGWTAEQVQRELGRALTWKSTDSLYLGWKPLIRLIPGDTAIAQDSGDWQRVWKDRGAVAAQFQPAVWPSQPVEDISQVNVSRLSSETIGKQFVKTSEGGWPGCASELLSTADLGPVELAGAPDERGKLPEGLFDGSTAGDTVRIDLTKVDLGKVLSTRKLQNGTRIVASGHGTRLSSPITIQNVWVRLKFEQTEGQPLVVQPRSVDGGQKDDAFLVVQNGGIEITGGAFSLPAGEKPAVPRWFARVTDGDLACSRCRIQGALSGTSRNRGMIQVQGATAPKNRPFSGPLDGYVALRECFVVGAGTLFEIEPRRRGLFVRDSVLVSLDDAIQVELRGSDSQIGGTIDLETSTISAAGNVLKLQGAPQGSPVETPLTVFADRCVFAPPLKAGGGKAAPAVLSALGAALEQKQLRWWENHCGYAADIPLFLREDSGTVSAGEFAQAWRSRWGEANVIAPLTGPQGVIFSSELPSRPEDRSKLEPASFALLESSRAATWDGGLRSIGAPLTEMKLPVMRGGAAPASTGAKPKQPAKAPPPVKPGF